MSDFQRNLFKKKILEYEAKTGVTWGNENDEEEEGGEERDSVGGLGRGSPLRLQSGATGRRRSGAAAEAKSWDGYFRENFQLSDETEGRLFNVYYTPPSSSDAPVFVFHHGTGSSGLSFAVTGARIVKFMQRDANQAPVTAKQQDRAIGGVLSFDMRGHGRTVVDNPTNNYSLEVLTEDFIRMCELQEKRGWFGDATATTTQPPLILIGHSLGGAVVTNAALKKRLKNVLGVVVLDAVEGPAIEALSSMDQILSSWPSQFDSISRAIEWHLQSKALRNRESASVSVPGIIKQQSDKSYTWILNPRITKPYWENWFTGLSSNFLSVPAARLLILAGTDRLDKSLMIGQMQGKYQLVVFAESGHFIQEDEPDKTALTLIDFWVRNGRPQNIVPVFGKFIG